MTPTMRLIYLTNLLLGHFKKATIAMDGMKYEEKEYPGTLPKWLDLFKTHLQRCLELVEQIEQELGDV